MEGASGMSDEEIIRRVSAEPWRFALLLDRYQEAFMRKALGIVRNELDAEEVVQDTFMKIYRNAHRFEVREGASFSSWAYAILINTALTQYRRSVARGKRQVHLDPELWELMGDPALPTATREHRDGIERVFAKLPAHFSRVLRLHYLERWPHKDIAATTGETVGAIKARIHRAKAAFRKAQGVHGKNSVTF